MKKAKVLAWFSCGVTSAVACKLAVQKHGVENVDVVYIHIDSAHPDNARFIKDCEKWLGTRIRTIRSNKYSDQFEVIEETGYVNGAGGARCTLELKKAVRKREQQRLGFPTQIFGFEFSLKEINRAVRFNQQHPEAKAVHLLIENELTKPMCADILLMNGIRLPKMYELGFHNNNCIGCVKGKKGYWNKIRVHFPEVFDRMAKAERVAGRSCIKEDIVVDGKKETRLVFLDELKPNAGRKEGPIVPDCGSLCEIKFTEIIDPLARAIYQNPKKVEQLYLF